MTDTVRTRSALATLLADNTSGAITPQVLRDFLASIPVVSSGSGAPSSAPASLFELYFDTTNKLWYFATATSAAADWKKPSSYVAQFLSVTGAGSVSSSTFATKGIVYDTKLDIRIRGVYAAIGAQTGASYKLVIATLSGDTIASILDTGPVVSAAAAGTYYFPCTTSVDIAAGARVALMLVRTDGTSTSVNAVQFPSSNATNDFTLTSYCVVRYATLTPTIGDNVNFATSGSSPTFGISYDLKL